jgi:hypothetical protein
MGLVNSLGRPLPMLDVISIWAESGRRPLTQVKTIV